MELGGANMPISGQKIKKRRKELRMSAEMLSEQLNVSRTTINRYENGYIDKMPVDLLIKIASVLETSTSALMGWDTSDLEDAAITKKISQLDEVNKQAVISIIDNLLATQVNNESK